MKEMKKEESDDIATQTLKRKKQAEAMHGKTEDVPSEKEDSEGPLVFDETGA